MQKTSVKSYRIHLYFKVKNFFSGEILLDNFHSSSFLIHILFKHYVTKLIQI